MKLVKNWIREITPTKIKEFLNYSPEVEFSRMSFSQFGEDLMLSSLLANIQHGFYVDIGAHHPIKFSNTYYFYKRGWKGINIDPLPGTKRKFDKIRPLDINVEGGVSIKKASLNYYSFKQPLYNTFDKNAADKVLSHTPLIETLTINVNTLKYYLDNLLPDSQKIHLMSIDVEHYDLKILESNDWERYRPLAIVVEDHGFDMINPDKSKIFCYLTDMGYKLNSLGFNSLFFTC